MSDIHRLPLVSHDLPYYVAIVPEPVKKVLAKRPIGRPRVWSRRDVTGHQLWYWRVTGMGTLPPLHGPFWTCADAHKDIGKELGEQASAPDAADFA